MVSENYGKENKVVLITGGTSGIGKAALAAMGADTAVYLASFPEVGGMTGLYLMGREAVSPAQPRDKGLQKRLWEVGEELTKLEVPS